jgi:hypothetical protein
MKNQYEEVHSYITNRLEDGFGKDTYASDLHHHLCNEDYFIVGTHKAKEFCGEYAFDICGKIKEYEESNFGECSTDLGDPEKVANMFCYIVGEEILQESYRLHKAWNECLTDSDHEQITLEVASVNITKVYNSNN